MVEEYQKSSANYFITDSEQLPLKVSSPSMQTCMHTTPSLSTYLHALAPPPQDADPNIKCLKAAWIWDSLKHKQQLSIVKYIIA